MGSWSRELKVALSIIVVIIDGYDDHDGLDLDEDGHDVDNNPLHMDEDDNHDDGDTGRALVETEPVRYQLEEIQLTLDKEDSEKVTKSDDDDDGDDDGGCADSDDSDNSFIGDIAWNNPTSPVL